MSHIESTRTVVPVEQVWSVDLTNARAVVAEHKAMAGRSNFQRAGRGMRTRITNYIPDDRHPHMAIQLFGVLLVYSIMQNPPPGRRFGLRTDKHLGRDSCRERGC